MLFPQKLNMDVFSFPPILSQLEDNERIILLPPLFDPYITPYIRWEYSFLAYYWTINLDVQNDNC